VKWALARGKRQPSAFSNANLSHAAHATLMYCLKKEPSRRSVGTVWRLGGRQTKCECRDRSDVSAAPA
jgi:hypothetical protein